MKIQYIFLLLSFGLIGCQSKVDLPEAAFFKTFGTPAEDQFWDGLLLRDGLLLFGQADRDFYLVKTDRKGEQIWEKQFGEDDLIEFGRSLIADDCNFLLLGWQEKTIQNTDILLKKINEEGEELWSKTYGAEGYEVPASICKLSNGNFCIAGTKHVGVANRDFYMLWIDEEGQLLQERQWGGPFFDGSSRLLNLEDGRLLLYGYSTTDTTGRDIYLGLMEEDGSLIWEKTYGTAAYEESQGIIQTADGGFLIAGHSSGVDPSHQVYVIRLDSDGNILWEKHTGGPGHDGGQDIFLNANGETVVLARSMQHSNAQREIFLLHLDHEGTTLSEEFLGGDKSDWGQRILGDENGYYIIGWSDSYSTQGEDDAYLEFYPLR
jgi:hypothetical protein